MEVTTQSIPMYSITGLTEFEIHILLSTLNRATEAEIKRDIGHINDNNVPVKTAVNTMYNKIVDGIN